MCLAVPGRVIEIEENAVSRMAKVSFGAVTKRISLDLLPDAVVHDFVIVHAGVAISILDVEEAQAVFKEMDALEASYKESST